MKNKNLKKAVAVISVMAFVIMALVVTPFTVKADNVESEQVKIELTYVYVNNAGDNVVYVDTQYVDEGTTWGEFFDGYVPCYESGVITDFRTDNVWEISVQRLRNGLEYYSATEIVNFNQYTDCALVDFRGCPEDYTEAYFGFEYIEDGENVDSGTGWSIMVPVAYEYGSADALEYVKQNAKSDSFINQYYNVPNVVVTVTADDWNQSQNLYTIHFTSTTEAVTSDTVTTNLITLKVGEAFGLSVENIDKLLKETGYEYTHDSSSFPWIFYGDRVVMDAEYLASTAGVDIYDVNAQKVLDRMYVADEEWAEVKEKNESGYYTEKYGVEEVWLVEEAEGMFFYARADEVGTTTITIPEYPVAGGGTITVNIPVVILPVDIQEVTGNVVDVVIESTTDNTITIKSDKDILSANVKLTSAKLESGEVYTNAEQLVKGKVSNIGNYAVYELNITDENGVEVHQLTGKVYVTMNVPFTMAENSTLKVYRVDNDTLVESPATVSNGKVTFETDHFSTYIFAEATQVTAPKTGDNSSTVTFVLLMIAGVSLCGVAVFRKKSRMTV